MISSLFVVAAFIYSSTSMASQIDSSVFDGCQAAYSEGITSIHQTVELEYQDPASTVTATHTPELSMPQDFTMDPKGFRVFVPRIRPKDGGGATVLARKMFGISQYQVDSHEDSSELVGGDYLPTVNTAVSREQVQERFLDLVNAIHGYHKRGSLDRIATLDDVIRPEAISFSDAVKSFLTAYYSDPSWTRYLNFQAPAYPAKTMYPAGKDYYIDGWMTTVKGFLEARIPFLALKFSDNGLNYVLVAKLYYMGSVPHVEFCTYCNDDSFIFARSRFNQYRDIRNVLCIFFDPLTAFDRVFKENDKLKEKRRKFLAVFGKPIDYQNAQLIFNITGKAFQPYTSGANSRTADAPMSAEAKRQSLALDYLEANGIEPVAFQNGYKIVIPEAPEDQRYIAGSPADVLSYVYREYISF